MINKQIIFFLGIVQLVLIFFNWLVYGLLIIFFPSLTSHNTALLGVLFLLAVSFLVFSVLTFNRDNFLLRVGYIISSIWTVLSFYFVLASLAALIIYLVFRSNLFYLGIASVFISGALTVYGLINARITGLVKIKVKLPNLPEFWKNKTAILVTDLHLGQVLKRGFANKVINLINRENPEIVFIPGDFYDGVHTSFDALANEFKKIKAPLGIYFCSGNHEMFAGYAKCEQALRGAGIKILENQKVEVQGLQIAGVAYKHETMPDLEQTLAAIGLNKNKPSILLKHVPLQLKEVEAAGFSLVLCGHSHHGQVWPGRLITKRYFKGFDYGLKVLKKLLVYTSSGAGTWGPPMRVFTKAEIVKIIFD